MSSRNTGEPPIGQPLSITRNDLETVRRMVRCHGVYDEADDVAQEVVIVAARYRRPIEVPRRLDGPEKQPLRLPIEAMPATPASALPNGGWLRLVTPGGSPAAPAPAPVPPAAPALRFDVTGQADLFSWTPPKPRGPERLTLFGTDANGGRS